MGKILGMYPRFLKNEIEPGKSEFVKIELGKKTLVKFNWPLKFEVKTKSGSIIKGIIPVNHGLEITPFDDVEDVTFTICEDSTKDLEAVKSCSDSSK